jgi:16S rRNA (guanine966-N2)-methyltransferase
MRERRRKPPRNTTRPAPGDAEPIVGVRIIGGRFRGRKLHYGGDPRTRPMKDRVREAVFNLVGPAVKGKHAIDLFAGTGVLGLEAVSRGAARTTLIEQHMPTARQIERSAVELGIADVVEVIPGNTFLWFRRTPDMGPAPWLVFCSPPFDFYVERAGDMLDLLGGLIERAPAGSVFVVEADERFDFARLPQPEAWDVRAYPPAVIGIWHR